MFQERLRRVHTTMYVVIPSQPHTYKQENYLDLIGFYLIVDRYGYYLLIVVRTRVAHFPITQNYPFPQNFVLLVTESQN